MNISNGAADAAAPEQRFEITMTLTEKDFAQFMRHVRALPIEQVISIMPCVLLGIIGALIGFIGWHWLARHYSSLRLPGAEILAVILVVGAFLLLWLRVIVPRYIRGIFRGQPVGMGDVRLVADEKEIVTDTAGVLTHVPWTLIDRIVENDRHIFLMYGRLTGIIVPKSALASADDAARFSAFARSKAVVAR